MNEILDDLEDQRSGLPPQVSNTNDSKNSKKRAAPEFDIDPQTESGKKQKREGKKTSKKERKAEKALKAIENAGAGAGGKTDTTKSGTKGEGETGTGTGAGSGGKGLNRKARRLLAHKQKEAEAKGRTGEKSEGVKEAKVKGDKLAAAGTTGVGEKNGKAKPKKSRKST